MKITKRNFETHLYTMNGEEQLETRKHIEDGEEQGAHTIVHLYYNKNGHCGTWCKGKGHVFTDKFPDKSADKLPPKKDLFAAFDWRTTDDPSVEDHEYILKADPEWRIQAHPEGAYFIPYYLRINEQDNTYHHTEFGSFTEPHTAMIKLIQQWKKTHD